MLDNSLFFSFQGMALSSSGQVSFLVGAAVSLLIVALRGGWWEAMRGVGLSGKVV